MSWSWAQIGISFLLLIVASAFATDIESKFLDKIIRINDTTAGKEDLFID